MCQARGRLHQAGLDGSDGGLVGSGVLLALAAPRVWVVVDSRVPVGVRDRRGRPPAGAYLVSSSEREKRFVQPGKVQAWGFSPVWVRM